MVRAVHRTERRPSLRRAAGGRRETWAAAPRPGDHRRVDLTNLPVWLMVGLIFCARVADVSLGTLRTLLVFRSYRALAFCIGFVETCVWLLAAGQVIGNLDAWYLAVAYALGFATGNVVGIWLESKLAVGSELVRVISHAPGRGLAATLRAAGHEVIELAGDAGRGGAVEVLLIVERRRRIPELLRRVGDVDPDAVCTRNDVRHASAGPPAARRSLWPLRALLKRK